MPDKMDVWRGDSGEIYYTYWRDRDEANSCDESNRIVLLKDQVLHIPGMSFNGLVGFSPIELARDAIGMAIATEKFGAAFFADNSTPSSVLEEETFFVGNGVKKPTGVLNDAQVGVTTASATAITFDEVMELYHSLKSPYRNKAVFVTNDLTIKSLRKLKDGNGQYLWNPSVAAGTPDIILGRPVYVSSFIPQIEAGAKVMTFGDFSYYWIGDRQGQTFERLNELFSATDKVGFKATQRVDGKLILPETVQVMQISDE
jgi:hypothetical protein